MARTSNTKVEETKQDDAPRPNRYWRAAAILINDPDISDKELAEKALMKERMAAACRDSFAAAVDVLTAKGWLKLPNGWTLKAAEKAAEEPERSESRSAG